MGTSVSVASCHVKRVVPTVRVCGREYDVGIADAGRGGFYGLEGVEELGEVGGAGEVEEVVGLVFCEGY